MEYLSSVTSMRLTNILTLLLIITVSSTSFPSQTDAIDLGVFDSVLNILNSSPELKELYDSMKKMTPELRSSVNEMYDSVKKKTPELSSGIREMYDSVKKKSPELSAGVREVFDSVKKKTPELSPGVKEVFDSVKKKSPELSAGVREVYDSVKKKTPELSARVKELFDLVKENARDLSSGKGSGFSSVVREIANQYLPDGQARFVAACATLAAEEVLFKVINIVPGGEPTYKILSNSIRAFHDDKEFADRTREIKEIRARIDRLEKEGCGCTTNSKKLQEQVETSELDLGLKTENIPNQDSSANQNQETDEV